MDIGHGDSGKNNGSLYISDASVKASSVPDVYQSSAQTTRVYKTTVSGLTVGAAVTCS